MNWGPITLGLATLPSVNWRSKLGSSDSPFWEGFCSFCHFVGIPLDTLKIRIGYWKITDCWEGNAVMREAKFLRLEIGNHKNLGGWLMEINKFISTLLAIQIAIPNTTSCPASCELAVWWMGKKTCLQFPRKTLKTSIVPAAADVTEQHPLFHMSLSSTLYVSCPYMLGHNVTQSS